MSKKLPLLIIDKVSKSYPKVQALKQVSFSIEEGEIFGLLGPNGAGKTTLISILSTLEKLDAGKVLLDGVDLEQNQTHYKSLLGVVPQELTAASFYSVEEVLEFHSGYYGLYPNTEWILYLLKNLGLYEHRKKKVTFLSGGMKRRYMIAKALVHKPKILLLDEPTAGVDIELRRVLWEFVKDLNRQGVTVLLTTHYLEEAEALCNRIAIVDKGSLLKLDATKALIQSLTHREITLYFREEQPVSSSPLVLESTKHYLRLQIPCRMSIAKLLKDHGISLDQIQDIRTREGSLEEAFRRIVYENG